MTGTRDRHFKVGVVAVSWVDSLHGGTVPLHIDECGTSKGRAGEGRGVEETDAVLLTSGGEKRSSGGESSGEGVIVVGGSKQTDTVARVGVGLEVEDGGVLCTTSGRGADPVGIRFIEAEAGTGGVALEASIDNEVLSLVATRLSHFETVGAGCGGGGGISGYVVLKSIFTLVVFIDAD